MRKTRPVTKLLIATALLVGCVTHAHAQITRVNVKDSVTYRFISTRKVDTVVKVVTKIVHDTVIVKQCYNAASQPITCPTTPPPVVTPPIDTTPAPIPPTPTDSGSHEPSGMTLRLERAYNAINENGWNDDGGKWSRQGTCGNWMSGCNYPDLAELMTIQQDPSAPKSPPNVGTQWFPKGYQAGGAPAISSHPFASARTVYVRFNVSYSAGWYGESDSEVNKNIYLAGSRSDGQLCTYLTAQGRGTGNMQLEVHLQCEPTVNLTPNLAPCIVTRGPYHKVELLLTGNSSGASDGTIDFWMDGVQCGHYANRKWQSAATTFNLFQWAPVYGGTATKVPADQYQRMDHIYVSGK